MKEAEPTAVRLRAVLAVTSWSAVLTATEAPMAPSEVVSPLVEESTPALWVAVAAYAPVRVSSEPVPRSAWVKTLEMPTATTGVTAIAPAEPLLAKVVMELSVRRRQGEVVRAGQRGAVADRRRVRCRSRC